MVKDDPIYDPMIQVIICSQMILHQSLLQAILSVAVRERNVLLMWDLTESRLHIVVGWLGRGTMWFDDMSWI